MDFASISAPSKFLHSRLDHVSEKIASLSLDLALAKTATDANPDSADKKAYHHALQKQLEALNDEQEFLTKFRDNYLEQLQLLNTSCLNCGNAHDTHTCRQPPKSSVTCHTCQRKGHFARQCRSGQNSRNSPTAVQCQLCSRTGHTALQCRTVKFTAVKTTPEARFINAEQTDDNYLSHASNPFQGNGQ